MAMNRERFETEDSFQRGKTSKIGIIIVAAVILVCVVVLVIVAGLLGFFLSRNGQTATTTLQTKTTPPPPPTTVQFRNRTSVDCHPDPGANETTCQKRNCMWKDNYTPPCAYPSNIGYTLTNETSKNYIILEKMPMVSNELTIEDIQRINMSFHSLNYDGKLAAFHFKFTDVDNPARYEAPVPLWKQKGRQPVSAGNFPDITLKTSSSTDDIFSFQLIRNSTGTILWDTSVGPLIYRDQYLQIATALPSANIYGFGEHTHQTFRHNLTIYKTWPAFARDQPPTSTQESFDNLYGVHPFYVCIEDDGNAHGILLMNSNAQEFALGPGQILTYRTIGGILDFYLFPGPKPQDVIQQYHTAIGYPVMPAYWSLGFQLCRYGYKNLTEVKGVIDRTHAKNIPHDVQYIDIDYMDKWRDFTVDNGNFPSLKSFVKKTQQEGLKWIFILDPALEATSSSYMPFVRGAKQNVYINWPNNQKFPAFNSNFSTTYSSNIMLGVVWPDLYTAFPDWLHPNASDWWTNELEIFHKLLPWDGLWIDMNEPAVFGTNIKKPWYFDNPLYPDKPHIPPLMCPKDKWDVPPYQTHAVYLYDEPDVPQMLSDKTLCMCGMQTDGTQNYRHYDVHSLYGWGETKATRQAVDQVLKKRGIIITRSTFPSSGSFGGHWLGDNSATWDDLRTSIIGIMEFDMFGIPYIGADICGFGGNTTEELCLRWMQLGAFYPFCRNHNALGTIPQDPGQWQSVAEASRQALNFRYHYLPFLYTCFYEASTRGLQVVQSLAFNYPTDETALQISEQFMWGGQILINPVITPGAHNVRVYFPNDTWYTISPMNYGQNITGPRWMTLQAPKTTLFPVHVRAGAIVPRQGPALNTTTSRRNPLEVLIALNPQDEAHGNLFWDDGNALNLTNNHYFFKLHFQRNAAEGFNQLFIQLLAHENPSSALPMPSMDIVEVLGISKAPNNLTLMVDGKTIDTTNQTIAFESNISKLYFNITNLLHLDRLTNSSVLSWYDVTTQSTPNKIDCHPDPNPKSESCKRRNCMWNPRFLPNCYYKPSAGYISISDVNQTVLLQKQDEYSSPFGGGDISNVSMNYEFLSYSDSNLAAFHFKFLDQNNSNRYEVPVPLWAQTVKPDSSGNSSILDFVTTTAAGSKTFAFQIVRASTGTKLWDTTIGGFIYSDQFLQISTYLPSQNVYGFGEHTHQTFKHDFSRYKTWPAFARDLGPWSQKEDFRNLYGVHPFYICIEPDGNAHGVLLFNSNAQEFVLGPIQTLTYRTIGGIFDFYLFPGPHPDDVIQQYHTLIGYSMIPPYWSLGFQLCKWGYSSTADIKAAVNRTQFYNIPLDVQYADIDYMDRYKDFTVGQENFGDLQNYTEQLQSEGMHWIFIIDPALNVASDSYAPFVRGKEQNVYIQWPNSSDVPPLNSEFSTTNGTTLMLGVVWPDNNTAFPDFLRPNTTGWWKNEFKLFHKKLAFDGIWIDMNEPANFGTNNKDPWYFNNPDHPNSTQLFCPKNQWDDPRYHTHAWGPRLSRKTLCMVGKQFDSNQHYTHYDVHSLYGWSESKATYPAVQDATGKRSVVISRSTFVSNGRFAGHWLGDNNAYWSDLRTSIIGIMEFDMFGIPYIGADICGFGGNTTEELCLRWQQLGAFYPFSRNHNAKGNRDQDPGMWPSVAAATRQAMNFRYHLLPYLYTLFYEAHTTGSGVIRPLAFDFPKDRVALSIDKQFLWGNAMLITPVTEPGVSFVKAYFPDATWYTLAPKNVYGTTVVGPKHHNLTALTTTMIPVHLRAGNILPRQAPANNTVFSRQNPLELLIAIGTNNEAKGRLFWDDGDSINIDTTNSYYIHTHYFRNTPTGFNQLRMASFTNTITTPVNLSTPDIEIIEILGLSKMADFSTLTFDGKNVNTANGTQHANVTSKSLWISIPKLVQLETIKKFPEHSYLTWFDEK